MMSDSGSIGAYDDAYDEVEPRSSTSFDASLGLFLTAQGLPVLWSCPRALLEQTVPYDLPALHDAPPWSLAQLSRNTANDVQYYSFLLRAWPLSSGAAELTFQPHESLALLLAQVFRRLSPIIRASSLCSMVLVWIAFAGLEWCPQGTLVPNGCSPSVLPLPAPQPSA
jgi:hypothetical protein